MDDTFVSALFFLSGLASAIYLGWSRGRLVEGIVLGFFFSWIGVVVLILIPENPKSIKQPYRPGVARAMQQPKPATNPAVGSISCGCAALVTVGALAGFMGLGMSSPSSDAASFSSVLIFGTMFAVPGAVLIYTGLLNFGVVQKVALAWSGAYFAAVFGFTWIFLTQLARDAVNIYGH